MQKFRAAYPNVSVEISAIDPIQSDLDSAIDVAICYGQPGVSKGKVAKLVHPNLFPVGSPNLMDPVNPLRHVSELAQLPLIHDGVNSWSKYFAAHDQLRGVVHQDLEVQSTSMAIEAACCGLGVALCNELEFARYIRQGSLCILLHHSMAEQQAYYLVSRSDAERDSRGELLASWLTNSVLGGNDAF